MNTINPQALTREHLRSRLGLRGSVALVAPIAAEIMRHQGCTQEEAEQEACDLLGVAHEGWRAMETHQSANGGEA